MKRVSVSKVVIGIPCLLRGGTETHTRALVEILVEGGYEVAVCCYYEHDEAVVEEMREAGAGALLLGLTRRLPGRNIHKMPRLAAALCSVFRREKPDVFHVQYLAPGAFPVVVARLCRVPKVVVTLHTPGHMYKSRPLSPQAFTGCCHFPQETDLDLNAGSCHNGGHGTGSHGRTDCTSAAGSAGDYPRVGGEDCEVGSGA